MNRRSFLTTAGAATIPLMLTSRKSYGAPLNINQGPFWNAGAFHASTIGNYYRGVRSSNDYHNLAIVYSQMLNVWKTSNLDVVLKPQYNTVTQSMISSTLYIPIHKIGNTIRSYNPAVTDAMVTDTFNRIIYGSVINGIDYKTVVLNNIRTNGMAGYIQNAAIMAGNVATLLGNPLPFYPGPNKPNPYSTACKNSALGLVGFSLGLLVLTVMTDGLDLIVIAGWEAINFWANMGAGGWMLVHEMECTTAAE